MKTLSLRTLAGAMLIALACASYDYGPVGLPEFDEAVRSSIETGGEKIFLSGKAQLWEGRSAYDAQREWGGAYPTPRDGVLVFLESRMMLLQWDGGSETYRTSISFPYESIRGLRWDLHGVGKMVQFDAAGHSEKITFTFVAGSMTASYNWARNGTAMALLGERAGSDFDLNAPVE